MQLVYQQLGAKDATQDENNRKSSERIIYLVQLKLKLYGPIAFCLVEQSMVSSISKLLNREHAP